MRASLNQPFPSLGQTAEEEAKLWTDYPTFPSVPTASPPATGPGIMGTIVGGIKDIFGAFTKEAVPQITQRVLYGKQAVAPGSMYSPSGTPQILAPKAAIPMEYLLVGGATLAVLLLSRKRGKKR